jgi:thymidylate synthase (FAD)
MDKEFEVSMVTVTPEAEKLMIYIARVSSPKQDNPEYAKLLKFCIKHGHWSVFEHAHMTVEINTSRALTQQIIRHRSFCFQEFSQRYAGVGEGGVKFYSARRQADKNRQSSVDDMPEDDIMWFIEEQRTMWREAHDVYEKALERGIAKECARFVLPMNTQSRIYMTGNARSWIHYLELRTRPNVQKEHRDIAMAILDIFVEHFPYIGEAMGWV